MFERCVSLQPCFPLCPEFCLIVLSSFLLRCVLRVRRSAVRRHLRIVHVQLSTVAVIPMVHLQCFGDPLFRVTEFCCVVFVYSLLAVLCARLSEHFLDFSRNLLFFPRIPPYFPRNLRVVGSRVEIPRGHTNPHRESPFSGQMYAFRRF